MNSAPDSTIPVRVVIGMYPHKRSVTIEVMAGDETISRRRTLRDQLTKAITDRIFVEG